MTVTNGDVRSPQPQRSGSRRRCRTPGHGREGSLSGAAGGRDRVGRRGRRERGGAVSLQPRFLGRCPEAAVYGTISASGASPPPSRRLRRRPRTRSRPSESSDDDAGFEPSDSSSDSLPTFHLRLLVGDPVVRISPFFGDSRKNGTRRPRSRRPCRGPTHTACSDRRDARTTGWTTMRCPR